MTRSAYLLFYRRRTPFPLGPPALQKIVENAESGTSADSDAETNDDDERSRARNSDSGNGQRLGGLSHNGSSSVGIGTGAAAGAAALHGVGSHQPSAHASPRKNGAGVVDLDDDDADDTLGLDGSTDEGYGDAEDGYPVDQGLMRYSAPYDEAGPTWSFGGLGANSSDRMQADDSDGVASDTPQLGSVGGEDLSTRMMEFDDDDKGDEVHEIHVVERD